MKNAIITGATGVTGNALTRYLLNQGICVTALVRPDSPRKRWLPYDDDKLTIVDVELGHLTDIAVVELNNDYDVFFHLGWEGSRGKDKSQKRNAMGMQANNILYELDAVELCKKLGCKRFVATGSQAEYGPRRDALREDMICVPKNGYGAAKYCSSIMTRLLCNDYNIDHIWARLLSVYGPYDGTHSLIDMIIRGTINGNHVPLTKGEQIWDYLYSYDAAKALYLLAKHGKSSEEYIVASGKGKPLRDYIEIIYKSMGMDGIPGIGELEYTDNQTMYLVGDITKLERDTGFVPEYDFESGIKKVIQWHKENRVNLL